MFARTVRVTVNQAARTLCWRITPSTVDLCHVHNFRRLFGRGRLADFAVAVEDAVALPKVLSQKNPLPDWIAHHGAELI